MSENYAFNEDKMLASISQLQKERRSERQRLADLRLSIQKEQVRASEDEFKRAEREAVASSLYEELDQIAKQEVDVRAELDVIWPTKKPPAAVKMTTVLSLVCEEFRVPLSMLTGGCRSHDLCLARYAAMKILQDAGFSYPRIGALLKRHHTTVIHGVGRAEEFIRTRPPFAMTISRIRSFAGVTQPERMCA